MTGMPGKRPCLVTVTSESFLPGTLLMIYSFLKCNRWFSGDIVIIHDNLPGESREMLSCFKRVKYLQVGEEIKEKLRHLARAVPRFQPVTREDRFYSLEVFRLSGCDRVIFIDSDVLVLGDIGHLLDREGEKETVPLLCCGDRCHYLGIPRDAETFLPIEKNSGLHSNQRILTRTFNSGFMVIDGPYLTGSHYRNLLGLLEPGTWEKIDTPHTDQVVLNLYFHNRCRMLDGRYNFLVPFANLIREKENTRLKDIKVLHFNGKPKPWDCPGVMEKAAGDVSVIELFKLWYKAYLEFLPEYHLRRHLHRVRKNRLTGGKSINK